MDPAFREIKNWQLFVDKFGENYSMHDAVVKRFDLNEDELTVVLNTVYDIDDKSVYDVTFKFSHLVSIEMDCELGDDYVWGCREGRQVQEYLQVQNRGYTDRHKVLYH